MGRGVWALSIFIAVLAAGASAAYYLLEGGFEGAASAVPDVTKRQPVGAARGGEHGNGLLAVAEPTIEVPSSDAAANRAVRPVRLSPRQAVELAQQSGLPKDAMEAAREIRLCKLGEGAARKVLELSAERGLKTKRPLSEIVAPLEAKERMCQELDNFMKGQYEPMLRKSMEGGERGAAALWWMTPEAKALSNIDGETTALDQLRRDATQCDRESLATYKVVALRFPTAFDKTELAAVHAASAQLVKDRKAKSDGFDELMKRFHPSYDVESGVDQNSKIAKTAEIINSCEQNRMLRSR